MRRALGFLAAMVLACAGAVSSQQTGSPGGSATDGGGGIPDASNGGVDDGGTDGGGTEDGGAEGGGTDGGSADGGGLTPLSTFVTYLGGTSFEQARDVAVDPQGNVIVVGGTQSSNFPLTPGSYDTTFNDGSGGQLGGGGPMDVFVTKLSPSGALIWSTFIGGPSYDRAYGVEVDAAGDIYIAGRAGPGFPTTAGALQTSFGGDLQVNGLYGPQDGFIAKLTGDGKQLLWSTYFGGDGRDFIRDLDLDDTGIYVGVGELSRPHPHVKSGAFSTTLKGSYDVAAAKVTLDGTAAVWGTYFGGSGDDGVPSVRRGPGGSVYLIGSTDSTNLPTTAGALQATKASGTDFWIARFTPDGSALTFCTYLGGNGDESHETHHGVVDAAGQVVLGFWTTSTNLPTSTGAIKTAPTGAAEAYVAKIASDGTSLVAATYLGGNGGEDAQGIGIDANGFVYVGGSTSSTDLTTTTGAHQASSGGAGDVWVAKLSPDFKTLLYRTYLGGPGDDQQRSLWFDGAGNAVSVGQAAAGLPTTAAAHQKSFGGGTYDVVVGAFTMP